jgi:hypothetical protein
MPEFSDFGDAPNVVGGNQDELLRLFPNGNICGK